MLRSLKHLESLVIDATDGDIGKITDVYFDDEAWVVRYVVVGTSIWLGGREVLLSPYAIGQEDALDRVLPVAVTKQQVQNSPGIDADRPISRQFEKTYLGYYGFPYYWGGTGLWGEASHPRRESAGKGAAEYPGTLGYLRSPSDDTSATDPHLRSCEAVKGYHVHAKDGEVGHVDGFIIDDITWSIRYVIVNTGHWGAGHQVVVSPEWIDSVSWAQSTVNMDLDRQAIKDAPAFAGDSALARSAEAGIYEHYGRRGYWLTAEERGLAKPQSSVGGVQTAP